MIVPAVTLKWLPQLRQSHLLRLGISLRSTSLQPVQQTSSGQRNRSRNSRAFASQENRSISRTRFLSGKIGFFLDFPVAQKSKSKRRLPKNITEKTDSEIIEKIFGKRLKHLEHDVVWGHFEPTLGHRATDLPTLHQTARRAVNAEGKQGRTHREAHRGADLCYRSGRSSLVSLQGDRSREDVRDRARRGIPLHESPGGQRGEVSAESGSTYAHHMRDALFMMPTPRVLANLVDQLDAIDMADSDTKGDLYEYMLGKIATAGQNGQFRTPRHIIKLMVDMTAPTPKDVICDPACGTAGFLIAAAEYLNKHNSETIYKDAAARRRFNEGTFHGYDIDSTMLRIGSMNMMLHGAENPDVRYRDSLV